MLTNCLNCGNTIDTKEERATWGLCPVCYAYWNASITRTATKILEARDERDEARKELDRAKQEIAELRVRLQTVKELHRDETERRMSWNAMYRKEKKDHEATRGELVTLQEHVKTLSERFAQNDPAWDEIMQMAGMAQPFRYPGSRELMRLYGEMWNLRVDVDQETKRAETAEQRVNQLERTLADTSAAKTAASDADQQVLLAELAEYRRANKRLHRLRELAVDMPQVFLNEQALEWLAKIDSWVRNEDYSDEN